MASKLVAPMSRYCRSCLVLPSVLLAGVLALGALAQGPPGSAPGGGAPIPPEIGDFSSRGDEWAWIEKTGEKTRLLAGGPGGAGKVVAEGAGWSDVAVGANQLWLLQRQGDRSRLLQAPKAGGEPREVLALPGVAAGLLAVDERVFWLETTPGKDPGLAFIPTLGGILRLRASDGASAAATLAVWPAGGRVDPRGIQIIGVGGGRIYVSDFNGSGTEFLSVPLTGGSPVRVAAEADQQHGVVHRDRLIWTAPSQEATPASRIRRLRAQKDGAEPEALSDWVPSMGALLSVGDRLYYAGSGSVYTLPGGSEPPVFAGSVAFGPVTTDGKNLIELAGATPVAKAP